MKPIRPRVVGLLALLGLAFPAGAVTVEGQISYEKVPPTLNGLDFAHADFKPAAQILVELEPGDDASRTLAQGYTDDFGNFRLQVPDTVSQVRVVAWAQSPQVDVRDPADKSLYGVQWAPFKPTEQFHFTIGDRNRFSGPFNILASIRMANRLLERLEPGLPLASGKLRVYWSPTNKNGTYYLRSEKAIYVLGQRDQDSDEFDDSVILHEYCHHLMDRFSRSGILSGAHGHGAQLYPGAAWDEGVANFFAQAVLGTPIYIDTLSPGKGGGWDLDEDIPEWEKSPGYWSEDMVSTTLWDIFASTGYEGTYLGLGLGPMWRVWRDYLPQQPFPYLITMADGLLRRDATLNAGITSILARRQIVYRYGVVPPVPVPFPRLLSTGVPVTGSVDSSRSKAINRLNSADYYLFRIARAGSVDLRLKVTGASPELAEPGAANLVLSLYDDAGRTVAEVDDRKGPDSIEQLVRTLPAGAYVIGVESFRWTGSEWAYSGAKYELTAAF